MSLSNEWWEYHLTPGGWLEGSEKLDFAGVKEKPIPPDRVLTLKFRERQSCFYASVERWYEVVWRHRDRRTTRSLVEEFGNLPERFRDGTWRKH